MMRQEAASHEVKDATDKSAGADNGAEALDGAALQTPRVGDATLVLGAWENVTRLLALRAAAAGYVLLADATVYRALRLYVPDIRHVPRERICEWSESDGSGPVLAEHAWTGLGECGRGRFLECLFLSDLDGLSTTCTVNIRHSTSTSVVLVAAHSGTLRASWFDNTERLHVASD